MNLEDAIKFATTHLSQFALTSLSVLANPISGYRKIQSATDQDQRNEVSGIWTYPVICLFLGSTIISFMPGQHESFIRNEDNFLFALIISLWLWLLFSIYAFFVIKIIGGTADFIQVVKTSVVVLSTAYLVSSLISVTFAIVMAVVLKDKYHIEMTHLVFVVIQAIFLLIYLPSNLGSINSFGLIKKAILGVALPASVLITNLALMVWFIGSLDIGLNK